jgi:excinuclease ABC subunit C
MGDDMGQLELKLKRLTHEPGVYRLLGRGNRVLYVGKAGDLANRVRSYFAPSTEHAPRVRSLLRRVVDFEVTLTGNPVEALILESSLIKLHKPRYNVNLKDDKRYPYVRVTVEEEFPRVTVTRDTRAARSLYFGPFSNTGDIRRTLRTVQRLFRLRVCRREIHVWREQGDDAPMPDWQPCLHYHLDHCSAPCVGRVGREEYGGYVRAACDFLKGRRGDVVEALRSEMLRASRNREYERAAKMRDSLRALESVMTRQLAVSTKGEDIDVLALARRRGEAVVELLKVREGFLLGDERFALENTRGEKEADVLRAFIVHYYTGADWVPRSVLLPEPPTGVEDLELLLTRLRSEGSPLVAARALLRASPSESPAQAPGRGRVRIAVPRRGAKRELLELARKNAQKSLEEELLVELGRRGQAEAALELAERLRLPTVPTLIEGLDVSNLGADQPVAGAVGFLGGRPAKRLYRHYKLKTPGPDDFAMLAEVAHRRYPKMAELDELPDLLLVDGGKGQLAAVVNQLEEDGLGGLFAVVGLAKREELLYLPGRSTPVRLPAGSPALHLVQRVRDEAHRFGLRFHRQLRRSEGLQSILERIPGIGPKRRKALLDAFGSLKKIRRAKVEEIAAVKGMSGKLAEELLRYLKIHYI